MMRLAGNTLVALALVALCGPAARGQTHHSADGGKSAAKGNRSAPPMTMTPEREAAALTFVNRQHAELGKLLGYLREKRPRQYQRAIRELYRASERLAQIRDRDAERYELELRAWKVQSHINLLAARWKMAPSPELRKQLEKALDQQFVLQKERLLRDRQKLTQRLDKLDAQLKTLDANRQADLRRKFQALVEVRRGQPARKPRSSKGRKDQASKKEQGPHEDQG